MNKHYLLIGLLLGITLDSFAQSPTSEIQAEKVMSADGSPALITFSGLGKHYEATEAPKALREQLALSQDEQMVRTKVETDALGFMHEKYQQYYRGIKVEHAVYSVHTKAGEIESLSGKVRHLGQVATAPKISAAVALERALTFVGAKEYMWQLPGEEAALKQLQNNPTATYKPQGELVFVADAGSRESKKPKIVLAWKFDIYAHEPLSHAYLYVDAQTGAVVLLDAIMKAIAAPFATRYSGARTVETDVNPSGGYRLRDMTRGAGIVTLNTQRVAFLSGAVDFVDNDNSWTAAEYNNANLDNAAGDAHLGAESSFDYWRNVHNRNSWDNNGGQLRSYVHYGSGVSNSFWDGNQLLYGDGNANTGPWTSLDITAHEIGHAVCQATAGLVYNSESGALNEGFSDIWGACVEQYTTAALGLTKSTWLIGEDFTNGSALRSMSDPKSKGQPAYYGGQNWVSDPGSYDANNDYGGVHANSGVLNHWFYIVSQGETATNEGGNRYSVSGIGIASAARIAYLAESAYLVPGSPYADARTFTIRAAQDLFGSCSPEVTAVTDAWYAVGIGSEFPKQYILSGPNQVCTGTTATFTASGNANVTWRAEPASFFTNPSGSGSQFSTSAVSGAQGAATITLTYCGGTTVKSIRVGPGEVSGYFYGGGQGNTILQTVQFVSPGEFSIFLNGPYSFTLTSSSSSVPLRNNVGSSASFSLTTAQGGVTIRATSSQPDCGLASNFTFAIRRTTYSYTATPNPANSELTVIAVDPDSPTVTDGSNTEPYDADLYDTYGKKVKTRHSDHGKAVLEIQDLPEGLYNLRIGTGKNIYSEHIQIKH